MKLIVEVEVNERTGVQLADVLCSVARTLRQLTYPLTMKGLHGPINHDGKFLPDPNGWRIAA